MAHHLRHQAVNLRLVGKGFANALANPHQFVERWVAQ
jgi:hypothetical protein